MVGALPYEIHAMIDCLTGGRKHLAKDEYLELENPIVLSFLPSFLERAVLKGERMLQVSPEEDVNTIFHGLRAPPLSIKQYIVRIFKYAGCSPSCFVFALVYLDRYVEQTHVCLTSLNIHRLLMTSIMVAAKFLDDRFFNNKYYAKVGGVSTDELNELEIKFLFTLDFRLNVDLRTYSKYCSVLKNEKAVQTVERPIEACGTKESWGNKDEPDCAQSIFR